MIVTAMGYSLSFRELHPSAPEVEQRLTASLPVLGDLKGASTTWLVSFGKAPDGCDAEVLIAPTVTEIPPKVALLVRSHQLAIGFDKNISVIAGRALVFQTETLSLVRALFAVEELDTVCVVQEAGVSAYDYNWQQRWHIDTDLIDEARLETDTIQLSFMDSPAIDVSLRDGSVLGT